MTRSGRPSRGAGRPGPLRADFASAAPVWGLALAWCLAFAAPAWPGTTGKISGRVLDGNRQPLPGANVAVSLARTGAVSEVDGRYVIINLPAGTYEVRVTLIGYRSTTVQEVLVSADQTTTLDVTLAETPLQLEEVVITAERPVVDLGLTSNVSTVSRKQIEQLPVQELQDIVNLQAGVVDGHFRGGRIGEVQYQVDGVTVNNPFNNQAGLKLDRSLLEEVQVVSGTFDAEYGQAMSGVVNAVLKRGTDRLEWDTEIFGGDKVFFGRDRTLRDDWRFGKDLNVVLNVSGPAPTPNTTFLLSGRNSIREGWLLGERRFMPTDDMDPSGGLHPGGDGAVVPLDYSREWSGIAKLSNRSLPSTELSYQAIYTYTKSRRAGWAFRLNPDGSTAQTQHSLVHGLDVAHTLGPSSFLSFALRQNVVDYRDMAFDNFNDRRYDQAGPLRRGGNNYENGAWVQGVDFSRFEQYTSALVYKGSYVNQVSPSLQIKVGAETQWPTLKFGNDGYLRDLGTTIQRRESEPPDFPGVVEYHPVSASAYAQNELEWNDLKVRAGLRYDFFDPRTTQPSDLANPANSIQGVPRSSQVAVDAKTSLSPRIGVSYPVSPDAALFFAYGHFYQFPALGEIFGNSDYRVLDDLAAGGISYGVLGNPDIRPERSVQYQFGYKQAFTDWLGMDLTAFYKDIRDLLGVEFVSTYNSAEYARLTNVDYGNVIGVTLALDQRPRGLFSSTLDYTWQLAQGNASDPRETATRASAGEDALPRQAPFNWDQRHTLNVSMFLAEPDVFSVSAVTRIVSGQPYTPNLSSGFVSGLSTNSARKPAALQVDLRAERHLSVTGYRPMIFGRVFNLFDTRYFNGSVFPDTGSPYYSRFATEDVLTDPSRFFGPRRIEVGIRVSGPPTGTTAG
jgi:outer membrane receptor protein involved in Fe transport